MKQVYYIVSKSLLHGSYKFPCKFILSLTCLWCYNYNMLQAGDLNLLVQCSDLGFLGPLTSSKSQNGCPHGGSDMRDKTRDI